MQEGLYSEDQLPEVLSVGVNEYDDPSYQPPESFDEAVASLVLEVMGETESPAAIPDREREMQISLELIQGLALQIRMRKDTPYGVWAKMILEGNSGLVGRLIRMETEGEFFTRVLGVVEGTLADTMCYHFRFYIWNEGLRRILSEDGGYICHEGKHCEKFVEVVGHEDCADYL